MVYHRIENSDPLHQVKGIIADRNRVQSIDFLRGLVMIIMALDHVRPYFHFDSMLFSPTDLQKTTPALFATRLITHLCAPTFIFLAGTSAYFIAQRKTLKETSIFLITRGLWLVILQVTLIQFGWNFDPAFHFTSSNIISTIGFCMILLSLIIHLPFKVILALGILMVAGHNSLDTISFEAGSVKEVVWSFLHQRRLYSLDHNYSFLFLYPIIPWVGVMALGYCLGRLYDQNFSVEKKRYALQLMGIMSLIVFFVLRWINNYGDPTPWTYQRDITYTVLSFFNVQKYPPCLHYLCFTLGIALVLLGILEGKNLQRLRPVTLFGKVALFYYVIHIYTIHVLALITVSLIGYPWQTMTFFGHHGQAHPLTKGHYGFSLGATYLIWISIVCLLYPLCVRWNSFKHKNKFQWWVSYV
ncbi:MAG TPA: heparan-alpha-glucosaminide N-acetyltransferase domain-containing protein [Chryseolinea sp.]|nr:heparan-alpha-glucosaminide N-acetyltransferase domain-containing protein [Chryseolinea sp.]